MSDDLLLQRIADLLDRDDLNSYEADFLSSIENRVKAGHGLSDKQHDVLDNIEDCHA